MPYSYVLHETGSAGMAVKPDPELMKKVIKEGGEIVADGHTHGSDDYVFQIDGKDYSDANKFSSIDIAIYNNWNYSEGEKIDNGYGKPIIGYVATPDGGLRKYVPGVSDRSNSNKRDAAGTPIKNYNIPIFKDLPSDPKSKSLRLNNIDPTRVPAKLPKNFVKI